MKNILTTIDNCSKKGTVLILTLFDGNNLKNINTNEYYIKLLPSNNKNYGRQVEVYIKDSVLNKPEIEFIVTPEFLEYKLKSIGFNLKYKKTFGELYSNSKHVLSKNEKNLSFLNNVYVFEKIK